MTHPLYHLFLHDNLHAITSAELAEALEALPAWRRERALKFRFEQGRKECAFAYLLLCKALREVYGIAEQPRFVWGEHGKPMLEDYPDIHFNLSHCKEAVACVVADRAVGVDVESIGRGNDALMRHVLNDAECEQVERSADPKVEFTRFWTQKEAFVKLTGRGIDDDLKNLLVKHQNVSLQTEAYTEKGYVVTVAMEH